MDTIRVVWGAGTGSTDTVSYDAALADAGIQNYNLVTVSSVVPPDASVAAVGTAPDIGPVGGRLTVVQARATAAGSAEVGAALGWAREPGGPGLFYEAGDTGAEAAETAAERVREGLDAGLALRDWDADAPAVERATATASEDAHATAVVVAAYGHAEPLPPKG